MEKEPLFCDSEHTPCYDGDEIVLLDSYDDYFFVRGAVYNVIWLRGRVGITDCGAFLPLHKLETLRFKKIER